MGLPDRKEYHPSVWDIPILLVGGPAHEAYRNVSEVADMVKVEWSGTILLYRLLYIHWHEMPTYLFWKTVTEKELDDDK